MTHFLKEIPAWGWVVIILLILGFALFDFIHGSQKRHNKFIRYYNTMHARVQVIIELELLRETVFKVKELHQIKDNLLFIRSELPKKIIIEFDELINKIDNYIKENEIR